MSKKKVDMEVFNDILGDGNEARQESNEHVEKEAATTTQKRGKGRPKGEAYEAKTFRVKTELYQKLKVIAIKEGRLQKEILDYALESLISRYEQKHGAINVNYEKKSIEDIF